MSKSSEKSLETQQVVTSSTKEYELKAPLIVGSDLHEPKEGEKVFVSLTRYQATYARSKGCID